MAPPRLANFLRITTLLGIVLTRVASLFSAGIPAYKGSGEPLHPSAVTTQHNGETLPVVGVLGQTAQIEIGGKRTAVPKDAGFTFARLATFSPGSVRILQHDIVQVEKSMRNADGMVINELSDNAPSDEYQATLVSDSAYPDSFVVLVLFERDFLTGGTTSPNTAVFFKQIGALKPNEEKPVVVQLGRLTPAARRSLEFFPLLFTDGREVRSQLAELSAAYFRRVEMLRHTNVLAKYVSQNANADRPLQPYVRIAPVLPADKPNSVSTKITARLSIDKDGIVQQADLVGTVPDPAKMEMERALRGWLFLPKLVAGQPVAAKAVVPLQVSLPPP